MDKQLFDSIASKVRTRNDFPLFLNAIDKPVCVEIGVAQGEYSELLLRTGPPTSTFYCVDIWSGKRKFRNFFALAIERLAPFDMRARIIRSPSVEAAAMFPDAFFDFIYIDANHTTPYVAADIEAWYPKAKPGSVFAGHDYVVGHRKCGVIEAVDPFVEREGLELHTTHEDGPKRADKLFSWYLWKPK